tara:strand:+ start:333 stop:620 length:288 start_codon:yes stop_codon:yes gene_type:complete
LEPVLPLSIVISVVGGAACGFLTLGRKFGEMELRQTSRIEKLDHRVDEIEIKLAKNYVDKGDLQAMFDKLDDRMERVDSKLDRILLGYDRNTLGQ